MGIIIEGEQYTVSGKVVNNAGSRLEGFKVDLFDKDFIGDHDYLGTTISNASGAFVISFKTSDFKEWIFDRRPDLYFEVYDGTQQVHSTENEVIKNATSSAEEIVLPVQVP